MNSNEVSERLGEYMLKGWVLTDTPCPNDGCGTPLMRSPRSQTPPIHFCVRCHGNPPTALTLVGTTIPAAHAPSPREPSPSGTYSQSYRTSSPSRVSTPPTDVSSALSSPTFAVPMSTHEAVLRRQQSDAAAAEMSKRLLKGWAMLADECPNGDCYGIPLLRPPRAGGGKDPRKECVACGMSYTDERDSNGFERLIPFKPTHSESQAIGPSRTATEPLDKPTQKRERADEIGDYPQPSKTRNVLHSSYDSLQSPLYSTGFQSDALVQVPVPRPTLESTHKSLFLALQALSQRMSTLSANPSLLDTSAVSQTAESMTKVIHTISQLENLVKESGRGPL